MTVGRMATAMAAAAIAGVVLLHLRRDHDVETLAVHHVAVAGWRAPRPPPTPSSQKRNLATVRSRDRWAARPPAPRRSRRTTPPVLPSSPRTAGCRRTLDCS